MPADRKPDSPGKAGSAESRNHVLLPRDPALGAFVSEVRQFLSEGAPMKSPIAKDVVGGR